MTDAVKPDNLPPIQFADAGGEEAPALPRADILGDQRPVWRTQLPKRHVNRPGQQQSPSTDGDDEAVRADVAALRTHLSAALEALDGSASANDSLVPAALPAVTVLAALNTLLHDIDLQLQRGDLTGIAGEIGLDLDLDLETLHRILTQLRGY